MAFRATPALSIGRYVAAASERDVLAYERDHDGDRLLIALNLSSEPRRLLLPVGTEGAVMASTLSTPPETGRLRADEGVVLRLRETV